MTTRGVPRGERPSHTQGAQPGSAARERQQASHASALTDVHTRRRVPAGSAAQAFAGWAVAGRGPRPGGGRGVGPPRLRGQAAPCLSFCAPLPVGHAIPADGKSGERVQCGGALHRHRQGPAPREGCCAGRAPRPVMPARVPRPVQGGGPLPPCPATLSLPAHEARAPCMEVRSPNGVRPYACPLVDRRAPVHRAHCRPGSSVDSPPVLGVTPTRLPSFPLLLIPSSSGRTLLGQAARSQERVSSPANHWYNQSLSKVLTSPISVFSGTNL